MGQLWSYLTSSTEEETNSYSNSRQQQPSYNSSNTSSSANYSSTSNAYSTGSSSSYPRTESYGYSDRYNGYQPTHNSTRYGNTIKLYHYTYNDKAVKIRREKKLKASTESTQEQYRQHGCGVYFTSLGPNVDPTYLARNNFTNAGAIVTNGLYRKISSVIEIDFYENEVEKITNRDRDLYIYRDSIDLNEYKGRYKIYRNKNSKLAIMLADN